MVAPRVEISAGYSGRRRNLEIINSSGIYEKRLKPAHIVMDNGDEKRRKWTREERAREKRRETERKREKGMREREGERERLLSRLSRR